MNNFKDFIGRQQVVEEFIGIGLVRRIAATLSEDMPEQNTPLPPLWIWAFFQNTFIESMLGADGHAVDGSFLPSLEGRFNRMWAGGRIKFKAPLMIGKKTKRVSTVKSIEQKQGRTGSLLFVCVGHEYIQDEKRVIYEEQDVVYRQSVAAKLSSAEVCPKAVWSEQVKPTTTLLFRYSAVTFNGHRIHYDYPYATEKEGYPDLVVHGPLIATLTLRAFCKANPHAKLQQFNYRSMRPLFVSDVFNVEGMVMEQGRARLWAGNDKGIAQSSEVIFEES